jgi:hypothetical protein
LLNLQTNEFDIGGFGTYATCVGSGEHAGRLHGWGGGIDLTYWLEIGNEEWSAIARRPSLAFSFP